MADKKYTPQEAAVAVLKKAEELYRASSLAKGDWKKIHDKLEREGYSKESADKIDGSIKAKLGKGELKKDGQTLGARIGFPGAPATAPSPAPTPSPSATPMGKSDEMQKMGISEKPVEKMGMSEDAPMEKMGMSEAPMKGHIKLAKFMGRMEHKRGQKSKEMDKGETGYEKGINTSGSATGGQSRMGNHVVAARDAKHDYGGGKVHSLDAKNVAKDKLSEMKQMPKPKLPG